MLTLRKTALAILNFQCSLALAGAMGDVNVMPAHQVYLGLEGGYSISTQTHLQPVYTYPRSTRLVFISPVNSDWTRDIGSTGLGGAFLGYQWNPNVSFQFSYDYRKGYDWNIPAAEEPSITDTIYDRYEGGDITIQTFLFDLILKPNVDWGGFIPYIKGGIGAAHNKITGIQNIGIPIFGAPLTVNLLVDGNSSTNFAWDAGVGANYTFDHFGVGLGYRFVDAGKLKTSSTVTDAITGLRTTISPLEAKHIFLHELTASIFYSFDFI
ncbi:outer membrane protein [Legionella jordanis]|uniref:Outer membrane protein beta-barrel domain-containing protein n=1 Tax=Legionella jordanis TaxID=456 RepID=A0A0W0V8Z0_9GAMM|nr:outer membrane beta-barrel protein [Legionella jordanis]KTD16572.1 hypothetical protein Ljor_0878 [Legionella jordanis]RMX03889.1 porin family protein [Legionella jordanis]RMX22046.1 porin family protein [Legionella jordanis]VEH11965.1 Opacity protein and related surface antigens [Legionella jordanis]HAT8712730.1 outer membrane beta-barrel protein [Legionella jordanis]